MQKVKRYTSVLVLLTWDFLSVFLSLFISVKITFPAQSGLPPYWQGMFFPTVVAVSTGALILLNLIFGNYSSNLKHFGLSDVLKEVYACTIFSVAFYYINTEYYDYLQIDPRIVILMVILLTMFQILGRSSVRLANSINNEISRRSYIKSGKAKRTLVFGAGEAGVSFCSRERLKGEHFLEPVVFIDDDENLKGRKICGIKVYGGSDKMDEAVKKFGIEEIVVAIPTATKKVLNFALNVCRENKCSLHRFGEIADVNLNTATITDINIEQLLRRDSVSLNMEVVENFVAGKTVVVTGGAGSIGSEICRQVLGFGCKHLVIFDIHENGLFDIENELKAEYEGRYSMRLGSIRDAQRLKEVFDEFKPELVFHAAAHKHVPMVEYSPREAIKNNVRGTINVAHAAIMHKCEKFILISTDKAVNPTNVMGASKRIAERAIQLLDTLSDTDLSAVRFGNVLGSNGSVVPFFRKQIANGGPVTVTHPDMKRYFMTIPEAVQLVLEAGAMADGGEIFVLNMGEPVKIYDLACDLIRLSGLEPEKDIEIKITGLRPGEKLFEEINIKGEDMTTTTNDQIFVMKPMEFEETDVSAKIKELEKSLENEDLTEMFEKIKELVPTFNHKSL